MIEIGRTIASLVFPEFFVIFFIFSAIECRLILNSRALYLQPQNKTVFNGYLIGHLIGQVFQRI